MRRNAALTMIALAILLSGCGTVSTPTAVAPTTSSSVVTRTTSGPPVARETRNPGAPEAQHAPTRRFLAEPQAGITPWLAAIQEAQHRIDINEYLLTDPMLMDALRQAAQRGVAVEVLIAGQPYRDASAVSTTESTFSGSGVQLKTAPARFEGAYAYDHAKYLVVDPGTPHALALLGSPNGTVSAFGGDNLEDAVQVRGGAIPSALATVFHADWTGQPAGPAPRQVLVLSPGSKNALVALLRTPGPIAVTAEELGDAPALYQALVQHGSQARVLVPASLSGSERARAAALVHAGVQVHTLATPYVHAKLIVTATGTFVGSQNFSVVSLQDNREVGVVLASLAIRQQALAWFNAAWGKSTAWGAAVSSTHKTWPYLPLHDSFTAVRALWGSPTSIRHSTYHGTPQVVWVYPRGQVDFEHGHVVAVQRGG